MGERKKEEKHVKLTRDEGTLSENQSEQKSHQPEKKDDKDHEWESLKQRLEEKEKEAKESLDRLLRVAADFENYKKRAAKEKEEWTKFANEELIKSILPFIDNLERAVNHAEKVADTGVLIEGIRLTLKEIHKTLNRFGLTSFDSVGQLFDPERHEAMLMVETDQHEPNRVVEEFQRGYLLNERLLRPATVSVSKPITKETQVTE